ncbi:hypothetical protein [Polaromonas sp.]|uniref:hypothetical protein n=1 Tax=Polaromonas sp. TaxID=1869339 RepID=UPI0013BC344E|nr:hypothetical protein [Polaromonas sp.]NDP63479.1 hypothetical protein [Polaromonas sp.]
MAGTQLSIALRMEWLAGHGDPVWMQDPACRSAVKALAAGVLRLHPVAVNGELMVPANGSRQCRVGWCGPFRKNFRTGKSNFQAKSAFSALWMGTSCYLFYIKNDFKGCGFRVRFKPVSRKIETPSVIQACLVTDFKGFYHR